MPAGDGSAEENQSSVAEEPAPSADVDTENLDSAPSKATADSPEEAAEEPAEKTKEADATASEPTPAAKEAAKVAEAAEAASGDEEADGEDLQLELLLPGEVDSEQEQ